MYRRLLLLLVLSAVTSACTDKAKGSKSCGIPLEPGIIIAPGIDLQVRDPFGRGQAIGTTVVARRVDAAGQTGGNASDTLNIYTAYNVAGVYSVSLTRPYYRDTTVSNITVTPDACNFVNTTRVGVVLQLAPGAPPMRAIVILGADFLATPGAQAHLIPHFDADPGVSTAVTWAASDGSLVSVDANGVVTAKCSKAGGTVKVTATSSVDPTVTATVSMGVAPAASCP